MSSSTAVAFSSFRNAQTYGGIESKTSELLFDPYWKLDDVQEEPEIPLVESKRHPPVQQYVPVEAVNSLASESELKSNLPYFSLPDSPPAKLPPQKTSSESNQDDQDDEENCCSEPWLKDYRNFMTPTKKWFDWSETLWVKNQKYRGGRSFVRDKREDNSCLKLLDAFMCKLPILIFGFLNFLFAVSAAYVSQSSCCQSSGEGPKRLQME